VSRCIQCITDYNGFYFLLPCCAAPVQSCTSWNALSLSLSLKKNQNKTLPSPVMFCSPLKLPKEYASISKIAVGSPLCRPVTKLFSDKQTLEDKCFTHCLTRYWQLHKQIYDTEHSPVHEKPLHPWSFLAGSMCSPGFHKFSPVLLCLQAPSQYTGLPWAIGERKEDVKTLYHTCKQCPLMWVLVGHSLVVFSGFSKCRHDLLREVSRFCSAPADAFSLGVVHISKIIKCSGLPHL